MERPNFSMAQELLQRAGFQTGPGRQKSKRDYLIRISIDGYGPVKKAGNNLPKFRHLNFIVKDSVIKRMGWSLEDRFFYDFTNQGDMIYIFKETRPEGLKYKFSLMTLTKENDDTSYRLKVALPFEYEMILGGKNFKPVYFWDYSKIKIQEKTLMMVLK